MRFFGKPDFCADDIRVLKCVRWADRTEEEVREKMSQMYPARLVMVKEKDLFDAVIGVSWVVMPRVFDVAADIKNSLTKGLVGVRKREGSGDDEFFISKKGLLVLNDFTVTELKEKKK